MTLEAAVEEEGTDPLAVGMRNPGRTRPVEVHDCHRREFLLGEPIITEEAVYPGVGGGERNRPPTVGEERGGELGRSRFTAVTSDSFSRGSARASRRRG